ncbi:50S ribosomal protein L25 [Patescibacteria group bacterium]|nr:50S ribosomal protein L25 [Patescibacteria group bacterium]
MADYTLEVQKRSSSEKPQALRSEDKVPGIMYGFETEPVMITVGRVQLSKLYQDAGESSVIHLSIDGTQHPVLVQDLQYNPLTDFISHVDFRRIDMSHKVETDVELTLFGEAPAVKELGGTLVQSLEEVEVSALPNALVREIKVDVSKLATFDDVVRVGDIEVPEGIEILTDKERTIATVQAPRVEEVYEDATVAVEEGADAEKVEASESEK